MAAYQLADEPRWSPARLAGRRRVLAATLALAGAAWLGSITPAQAALVVTPSSLTLNLTAGGFGIVSGDITNTTGFDLLSSEFFGSFSGFPGDALSVDQLLGLTDLPVSDRTTTRGLDLFSVQLGAGAQAGQSYSIDFFFGDVNGNFSSTSTLQVNVQGAVQGVPEPHAVSLVGAGLFCLAMAGRRRQARPAQED